MLGLVTKYDFVLPQKSTDIVSDSLLDVTSLFCLVIQTATPFGVAVGPFSVAVRPFGVAVGPFGVAVGPFGVAVGPFRVAVGPFGGAVGPFGLAVQLFGVAIREGRHIITLNRKRSFNAF